MILIVVLDDNNGMMFNQRRQSQDRVLREKILELSKVSVLWINDYTGEQFEELPDYVKVSENALKKAGAGEFCFMEDRDIFKKGTIEKLIIFKWNRVYPHDLEFTFSPQENGMVCTGTEEFAGNSHERITMEVWE